MQKTDSPLRPGRPYLDRGDLPLSIGKRGIQDGALSFYHLAECSALPMPAAIASIFLCICMSALKMMVLGTQAFMSALPMWGASVFAYLTMMCNPFL